MAKYYYKKSSVNLKRLIKSLGILLIFGGLILSVYSLAPIISWQIYFSSAFAQNNIQAPIPRITVLDPSQIANLIKQAKNNITVDYTNAANWYPNYNPKGNRKLDVPMYSIYIPKLNLENVEVTTTDYDLTKHAVNYQGTAIPPENGNSVIFGHSTLPQLFNPKDYKTIFANAYKLKTDDEIFVNLPKITYKYKIINITVVEAEDMSPLSQDYSGSFLTLITCTPPGTTWKRLVIKAKLEKI